MFALNVAQYTQLMRSRHTILVVDDHPPSLYVASRLLEKAGFKILQATNGEDAMKLADGASALLMDVNLPDVNGVAVCQNIKSKSSKPVVLMSAVYVDHLHRDAAVQAGADEYLVVPLESTQLVGAFDRLLGGPTAAA
jgi:CheY-like chemotaxis protein